MSDFREFRERHVINYLTMFGPVTKLELSKAIPGDLGGNSLDVARRLITSGRIEKRLISDMDD